MLATSLVVGGVAGCSSGKLREAEGARQSAQAAFEEGLESLEEGNYQIAEPLLQQAMAGELSADLFIESGIALATCLAKLERSDDAIDAIERIREGLPSDAHYHMERAYVFEAAGKKKEAKSEIAAAKKIDPRIRFDRNR